MEWEASTRRVSRNRLSAFITTEIVSQVVRGNFAVGETLPSEAVLSATFEVSRPVVREAVKAAELKGLVTSRQGDGTTVRPRHEWDLLDPEVLRVAIDSEEGGRLREEVITLRRHLEVAMLRKAAPLLSPADFAEMGDALDRIDSAHHTSDAMAADAEFHGVIHRVSGDEVGRAIVWRLRKYVRPDATAHNVNPEQYAISTGPIARSSSSCERETLRPRRIAWPCTSPTSGSKPIRCRSTSQHAPRPQRQRGSLSPRPADRCRWRRGLSGRWP